VGDRGTSGTRFEVLGPLRAWRDGAALNLGPVQQRVLLAVLLLHTNRPVGKPQLIGMVWGDDVPTYAVNLMQRRVSGLRRALLLRDADADVDADVGAVRLEWVDAGYVLTVPDDDLDLARFDAHLDQARTARSRGDPQAAADALRAASLLWKGPFCDGLSSPWLDAERDRLAERYLNAVEERIDLDLTLGADANAVTELRQLIAEHPLRERLHGLLMLALYRAGRQADALDVYQQAHRFLGDELGIEPDAELQTMNQRILRADPTLSAPATATRPVATTTVRLPVPAQLPHALPDFVGRDAEIERLTALLPDDGESDDAPVVIVALAGMAGVGKTSLAVAWAHRIRDRYPDGQLYINLRGFEPGGQALEPVKAIRSFLEAVGVHMDQIPAGQDEQAALYRSALVGRRVLVVLDNARDSAQVRPLLPGSPGSLVVVTSRDRLVGLVAVDGARPVAVHLLSEGEARELLVRRLGSDRVAAEPAAVDEIIASCARLPLALSVVCARAAMNPRFRLAALAGELRDARGNLDVFDGGDPTTDVRAVFACSYDGLSRPAARLFRLLGLHAGPDVSTLAAANLAARPSEQTRSLLDDLARAHLVTERSPGRFTLHDLLRAYARELVERTDGYTDRQAAVHRALDYYLHSADMAGRLLLPFRDDPVLPPPDADAGIRPADLNDHGEAMAWLIEEEATLLAVGRQAAREGYDRHVWRLAWALGRYLYCRGLWHEAATASREGLHAAERLGDGQARALSHSCLAYACVQLRRFDEAEEHMRQALDIHTQHGDRNAMAYSYRAIAHALDKQQRYREALPHAYEALRLFELTGHAAGESRSLNAVGWFHIHLGDPERAIEFCLRALTLQEKIGDRVAAADTLDSLGGAYYRLGRHGEAVDHYRRAVDRFRELGDLFNEAISLVSLGRSRLAMGEVEKTRAAWELAAGIFERLGRPESEGVRMKLKDLHPGAPGGDLD
jgi:DNA-binding SARP family transcriptional activator/Tfp pilus assembly protein PilF